MISKVKEAREFSVVISTQDDTFFSKSEGVLGGTASAVLSAKSIVTSASERWRSLVSGSPDVVCVVDVGSPVQASEEIERMAKLAKHPRIVLVARCDTSALEPFASRVFAIIPMEGATDVLPATVQLVLSGLSVASSSVLGFATEVAASGFDDPDLERLESLSFTEARVLLALSEGCSNKLIAKQIGISDNTVRVHVRTIFLKLGVQNRTQAALMATRYRYSGVLVRKTESGGQKRFPGSAMEA